MFDLIFTHDTQYRDILTTAVALQHKSILERITAPTPYHTKFKVVYSKSDPCAPLRRIDLAKDNDYALSFVYIDKRRERYYLYPSTGEINRIIEISISRSHPMSEMSFVVYTDKHNDPNAIKEYILSFIDEEVINPNCSQVVWYYSEDDHFEFQTLFEDLSDDFYYQAYPNHQQLKERLLAYIQSMTPVILIKGPPGSGKTRLVREIIRQYGYHYDKMPSIAYTTSQSILNSDQFFIEFMNGDKDILLLEDIDFNLSDREGGNTIMPNFLNTSDGFIQLRNNKKIIFTTNILKTDKIDQALIRAGRCFDVLDIGTLNAKQAQAFLKFLGGTETLPSNCYTVADIFSFYKGEKKFEKQLNRRVGFGRR